MIIRTMNGQSRHPTSESLSPADEPAGIEAILRLRRADNDHPALGRLRWGLVALHEPLVKSLILGRLGKCPQSHGESVCDVTTDQFYEHLCKDEFWQEVEVSGMTTVKGFYTRLAGLRVIDHLRGRKPWANDHPPQPVATTAVPGQAFPGGEGDDFESLLERTKAINAIGGPEEELFDAEIEARLFDALGGPETIDAVVVGLRLCEGLTHQQIARVLAFAARPDAHVTPLSPAGLALALRRVAACSKSPGTPSPDAIKVRIHRALHRIDSYFDQEEPSL